MASLALTLLQLAASLLLSVQSNPMADPAAVARAMTAAAQAVQYAQSVLGTKAPSLAAINQAASGQSAALSDAVTASLTANGKTDLAIAPGTNVNYIWNSANGATYTSSLTIYDSTGVAVAADPCGNKSTNSWALNGDSGSIAGMSASCQLGYHYLITYKVADVAGDVATAEVHIAVTNTPTATTTTLGAAVASLDGVQGYNPTTDVYTNSTAQINSWLILYGKFDGSNNKVLIDGVAVVPNYQSTTQINVPLAGIAAGVHTVSVITSFGITAPLPFAVAAAGSDAVTSTSSLTLPATDGTTIGTYIWGTQYVSAGQGPIADPVAFAASKGFKVVRLLLSPRSSIDYGLSNACDSNMTLAQIAASDQFKKAFANTSINTFVLTAYDHASYGDCTTLNFLRPSFYTAANIAAVSKEYQDLVIYLYQTYQGTGKTFIISNWEGDNQLYCDDAYGYATNATTRAACDATYPARYAGNVSVDDSLAGMEDWLMARKVGINAGRTAAAAQGLTGVSVYFAAEFNSVHFLHDNNYESVLYDVLPVVKPDYVSYSSYESINQTDPAGTLSNALQTIKGVVPGSKMIVGEYGFDHDALGAAAQTNLSQVSDVIKNSGAAYGIIWQLFDQPGYGGNYGLFSKSGAPQNMRAFLPKQTLPL